MKRAKITISFILAAALLFCALPLTPSAVKTVDEVIIFNYEYPLIGITPSDMPKIGIPDEADYVIDDFCWCIDPSKEELGMDEPFQAGSKYCMMIRVLPAEGCEFSRFASVNVSGDVDQGELLVRPHEIVIYTPPVTPYSARIEEVVINGFTMPQPGQSYGSLPPLSAEQGANYSLEYYWLDNVLDMFLSDNSVFYSGGIYTFYAVITPADGFCFVSDVPITVNGDDIGIDKESSVVKKDHAELLSTLIYLGAGDSQFIDKVEINGLQIPEVGQTAGENLGSIGASGNCVISYYGWNIAYPDTEMENYQKFEAGREYYMYFVLSAAAGYVFNPTALPEILINGSTVLLDDQYTYYDRTDGLSLVFFTVNIAPTEPPPDPWLITEVNINGFKLPRAGQTLGEIASAVTVNEDAPYTIERISCVNLPASAIMMQNDRFKPGCTYRFSFTFAPKDGYHFDETVSSSVFYINGGKELVASWSNAYIYDDGTLMPEFGTIDVTLANAPVSTVGVTGYRVPAANQTAGDNLAALEAVPNEAYDFVYAFWINVTDDAYMTDSDLFEAGKTYRLEFRFRAEDGYYFDPDRLPGIAVNGSPGFVDPALTYTDSDCQQLTFYTRDVTPVMYGDCNGDGKIDGKDLIRLRRHLVGTEVDLFPGADCNGDGEINGKDLIRLRRYLLTEDASLLIPR